MSRGPLQRLTDEEIVFLKQRLRQEIRDERYLYDVFWNDHELYQWLERKILMTADHFKLRYSKQDE